MQAASCPVVCDRIPSRTTAAVAPRPSPLAPHPCSHCHGDRQRWCRLTWFAPWCTAAPAPPPQIETGQFVYPTSTHRNRAVCLPHLHTQKQGSLFTPPPHTETGQFVYPTSTHRNRAVCLPHLHTQKQGSLFTSPPHTETGQSVYLTSTHRNRAVCLPHLHTQKQGSLFTPPPHTEAGQYCTAACFDSVSTDKQIKWAICTFGPVSSFSVCVWMCMWVCV